MKRIRKLRQPRFTIQWAQPNSHHVWIEIGRFLAANSFTPLSDLELIAEQVKANASSPTTSRA